METCGRWAVFCVIACGRCFGLPAGESWNICWDYIGVDIVLFVFVRPVLGGAISSFGSALFLLMCVIKYLNQFGECKKTFERSFLDPHLTVAFEHSFI